MPGWDGYSAIVADDHELFRAALAHMLRLEFDFRSVIEASSLDEAIDQLGRLPDVTLASIDLTMPGMDGAASLHAIREVYPGVRVTVITASERREDILRALDAGVHGYVPKTLRICEIAAAIRTVLEGRIFIPPTLAAMAATPQCSSTLPATPRQMPPPYGFSPAKLSPRQKQVLESMTLGNSNKQIARHLHLAEGTVKVHIAALFRALGVHNRVEAIAAMTERCAAAAAATVPDQLPNGLIDWSKSKGMPV